MVNLEKSLSSKHFGSLGIFVSPDHCRHLIKVEEIFFIHAPKNWAVWKYPDARKISGSSRICVLPDNFRQTIQVEKKLCYCPSLQVFSYMKESMSVRTTLEALVNMKGYFNPFEIKRYKLTSFFHPNLMSNLTYIK